MNFSVTVLGSGSAVPTSRRGLTAQYVVCRNRHILIDCGEGTQMKIRQLGIKFQRIDHILISHLHGDHYYGLVGLLSTMHMMGRERPIHIYAPAELEEIIRLQTTYGGSRLGFELIFHARDEKVSAGRLFEDEKCTIDFFPLKHRVPTSGFLIREKPRERRLNAELAEKEHVPIAVYHVLKSGVDAQDADGRSYSYERYTKPAAAPKSYAFCSDTAYSEEMIAHIQGVNMLYHEATFTTKHKARAKSTMHSTAEQAAKIAAKAKVGQLLMGHLSARYDSIDEHIAEARKAFENCHVAEDGQTYWV